MSRFSSVSLRIAGSELFRLTRRSRGAGRTQQESFPTGRYDSAGYSRSYSLAIVEPVGNFCPVLPDEEDPRDYRITEHVFSGLTLAAASEKAGDFNDAILAKEGPRPRFWAIAFAPGALEELQAQPA